MPNKYFSDPRDVALGLSTDGFAPFRRRKKTCWPLILFNYNLPPEIRFHIEHVLSLGVIPGPKKPVDFDSFLWPAVVEFLRLELGVHAYDVLADEFFILRAFLILVFGDIPAISMVMRMKGHNGFRPCRMCNIHGVRVPDSRGPTHYVPLDRSHHPHVGSTPDTTQVFDASNLPLRTHDEFMQQAHEVQSAANEASSELLAKTYGIKGIPILSALSSLSFPKSFPYDFMHLIWENVAKNLILLWSGDYKGLDVGQEDYQLNPTVWEAIGVASAQCGDTIPAAFGPRTPNVASDKVSWTADSRSFWFLYVGPVLLARRFSRPKYYSHFVDLVKLLHCCLQFELTTEEVSGIRNGFIKWVKDYESIYYQHNPSRLATCPVTIHALLHIADSIEAAGPVWASWAFPMERYCSTVQRAIRSRRFPFASINRYLVDHTRLQLIKLTYNVKDQLDMRKKKHTISGEQITTYNTCTFLPRKELITLERGLLDKVVAALCTRFGATPAAIRRALPETVTQWARLRINNEGDTIRAATMASRKSEDSREATYIRYELLVDKNARYLRRDVILEKQTFYGELQHVLVVKLEAIPSVNSGPTTVVLSVIRSCPIEESHASLDIHYYSKDGPLDVVDITTIQCLTGRIKDRGRWALIDRSGGLARALYVEDE